MLGGLCDSSARFVRARTLPVLVGPILPPLPLRSLLKRLQPLALIRGEDLPHAPEHERPRFVRVGARSLDAVDLLRDKPVDLMIVIGGYNSSNTCNLARICAASGPTFHIADPECLVSPSEIRHRPAGTKSEVRTENWLPAGEVSVGLTSGASTPDNLVGAAIARLEAFCARARDRHRTC